MKKLLLPVLLPAAVLALASCSSEPSDWRADKKVSLDLIPPGTRPSDNFDLTYDNSPEASKGGAIPRPINSGVQPGHLENPTPSEVMSADTQDGTAEPKQDTPTGGQSTKQPGATDGTSQPGTAGANNTSAEQRN